MELAALIVATLALVLVFYVERLRRPKLDIVPVRVMAGVPARWSSNPQPIRPMPTMIAAPSPGPSGPPGRPTTGSPALPASTSYAYDPTLDPRRHDVAVSPEGEEVAVAILYPDPANPDAGAYAFGTES